MRVTKRGRYDVKYYYDHLDRLAARKDNFGNITQFLYTNHQRPNEVNDAFLFSLNIKLTLSLITMYKNLIVKIIVVKFFKCVIQSVFYKSTEVVSCLIFTI